MSWISAQGLGLRFEFKLEQPTGIGSGTFKA